MKKHSEIMNLSHYITEFEQALLDVDQTKAESIFKEATSNHDPFRIAEALVVPCLERLGERWSDGYLALAQVYMAGKISENLLENVLPKENPTKKNHGKIAIAVLEDHHLLGKRIIKSVILAHGYSLIDYGHGLSIEHLAHKLITDEIDVALISTLMYHSAIHIKKLIQIVRSSGLKTRFVVGGAPFNFNDTLWKEVGADAMGKNSADALAILDVYRGELL